MGFDFRVSGFWGVLGFGVGFWSLLVYQIVAPFVFRNRKVDFFLLLVSVLNLFSGHFSISGNKKINSPTQMNFCSENKRTRKIEKSKCYQTCP